MAIVRVRQHVNPLSDKYQQPIALPDWSNLYENLSLPLHLDIGSARGIFLLEMAKLQPNWNFLGLEIREPLVEQANQWRDEAGDRNLHYLFCNANYSLGAILSSLPAGCLHRVTIQFPDPWFKKRHQKRRVVQPEVVNQIAQYLIPGGMLFLQSDIRNVAEEMGDRFSEHPAFVKQGEDQWYPTNPLPVSTEREKGVLEKGEPVYRLVFVRSL
ncbi:MAG: tRNA (guanosine(46)-N7)-methyltransferase TrmB [Oculatellaceae cyanobacterium Prado106]|jgi:tRNA (guanine-N7-)-methyltransferase|nr:tRNA (guanosine(46)-N7)-methyltransferase TrmB [Oculatellaceae cyanobacterium Prado106]